MYKFQPDAPIICPNDDKFGYGAFADNIASCISKMHSPSGNVIAIHGPWGAGKSSLINMVDYKVRELDKSITIVPFKCWCYLTEEGVVSGFFQEIYYGLKSNHPDIKDDFDDMLRLGAQAIGSLSRLGSGIDPISGAGASIFVSAVQKIFGYDIEIQQIEKLQKKIGKKLNTLNKRLLVTVDEIDRLSPEELIAVFRVIKSVGRIDNVMYLLAYDRTNTEKLIKEKYHVEGSHYLEKFVQANFDLPEPDELVTNRILDARFNEIFKGRMSSSVSPRLYNMVHTLIVPEIKNLRDVYRLTNMLSVTFEGVKDDVDLVDFVALEVLRLFHPAVYEEIRVHKEVLTRPNEFPYNTKYNLKHDEVLEKILDKNILIKDRLSKALLEAFPVLRPNFVISENDNVQLWNEQKRVCSPLHVDTYFRFSTSGKAITYAEFQEFCEKADDEKFVKDKLLSDLDVVVEGHGSKSSLMLDKIALNATSIEDEKAAKFIATLYYLSGAFQEKPNFVNEFGRHVDNVDRIIRISINLLTDRFSDRERSKIVLDACGKASLGLLMKLCRIAFDPYARNSSGVVINRGWTLMISEDTKKVRDMSLLMARKAATDGSIIGYNNFYQIIYNWDAVSDRPDEVAELLKCTFESDENVIKVADEFFRYAVDMSDHKGVLEEAYGAVEHIIDIDLFISRLHEVYEKGKLNQEDQELVEAIIAVANLASQEEQDHDILPPLPDH